MKWRTVWKPSSSKLVEKRYVEQLEPNNKAIYDQLMRCSKPLICLFLATWCNSISVSRLIQVILKNQKEWSRAVRTLQAAREAESEKNKP